MTPPTFFQDGGLRRFYHQVWDWIDAREYVLHVYLTQETNVGWETRHLVSQYRAVRREELTAILRDAGFHEIRWLMPEESGFYQPLGIARAG